MQRVAIAFLGLALVSGCGGGSSANPPVPAAVQAQGSSTIQFTLTVPSTTAASAVRRAASISPSTQSVGFVVNGGPQQVFAAAPTSPGCAAQSGGTTCTLNATAPAGSDTFVVTVYSGPNGTGSALDQMSSTQTVALNKLNSLTVVLAPVISTTQDSGPGSLRQTFADANPGDTITFIGTTPATITLTSGPVTLTKNVTFAGPGASNLTISGNNASQIFIVSSGVTAAISGATLTRAILNENLGGAIDNRGTLAVNSVTLSSNTAPAGAAIYNESSASLTVVGSTFTGNSIISGGSGGAIYSVSSAALLNVTGSTFTNNSGTFGGAIANDGAATLANDIFNNNGNGSLSTYGNGGAVYANGALTVTGSTFTSNVAGGAPGGFGLGGAIYSNNLLTISGSTFTGNSAGGTTSDHASGGAIYFGFGTALTLNNDAFSGNMAGGVNYGTGGAIESGAPISGTSDTFTSNTAFGSASSAFAYGGAIDTTDTITLTNSTFSGNAVNASTSATGFGYGGAINAYAPNAVVNLTSVTFTGNSIQAGGGPAYGGALYLASTASNTVSGGAFTSNSAVGSSAAGGAILQYYTPLVITGVTFSGNTPSPDVYDVSSSTNRRLAPGSFQRTRTIR